MKYSIGKFAELAEVSIDALRDWDNSGKLVAHRTKGKQRYYTDDHFDLLPTDEAKTRCPHCHKLISVGLTKT